VRPSSFQESISLLWVSQKSGAAPRARIQQVEVLERAVAVVVLGVHAEDRRLDAQVDVLRDQRDARLRVRLLQHQAVLEDRVVGAAARQGVGSSGWFGRVWKNSRPGGGCRCH
jgi:hypothetical protein